MSNAMRSGKRVLAGLAAGALGAGLLTFVAAPSAMADNLTGTVSPVRATYQDTVNLDVVPYASLTWSTAADLRTADTAVVTLTAAPTAKAILAFAPSDSIGKTTGGPTFPGNVGTVTLGTTPRTLAAFSSSAVTGPGTGAIALAADTAGTYRGTLATYNTTGGGAVLRDTISFAFTTSGLPASLTLLPASSSTSVNGKAQLSVALRDSAGNLTQPDVVDTITMAVTGGAPNGAVTAVTAQKTGSWPNAATNATSFYKGTALAEYTGALNTAGVFSVTATPGGTLPGLGVATQTASVNVSGTIDDTLATVFAVTRPTDAVTGAISGSNYPAQIPAGTSNVTVQAVGPASLAGKTIRFAAWAQVGSGTIDGVAAGTAVGTATSFKDVAMTATSTGSAGTFSYVLGGNLLASTSAIRVQQVNAANTSLSGNTITITQTPPTVAPDGSTITTSPSGTIVAQLGAVTPVTVTVSDQYGDPITGWTVRALRSGTTQLAQAVTNASGQATVNVTNASGIAAGTTENYVFTAQGATGSPITAAGGGLNILYTATGDVTTVSVAVNSGNGSQTSPILNTTAAVPVMPFVQVPFGGTVNAAGNAASTSVYTVASAGAGQVPTGQRVQFTPTAIPANTVTVTVPTGVKVVDGAGLTASLLWSGGSQSVSVASGQPVYVFATKTGIHDITFTSGKITTVAKVAVGTVPAAAYNISATPATRNIEAGAFSTVELKVTDVFGNPVPGITGGVGNAGSVVGSATGEVLLSGLTSSNNYGTGAAGTSTITLIAGKPGTGTVTFGPTSGTANLAAAWQAGYVPPTGAPAPVTSAAVAVVVTDTPDKVITISGSRGTVSGKSGIIIDGVTDGIENGKTVTPFIRFPGETTFTAGSARPAISNDEFTWQRKTGKRVTVYVELSDDASIRSNRVTIQAS